MIEIDVQNPPVPVSKTRLLPICAVVASGGRFWSLSAKNCCVQSQHASLIPTILQRVVYIEVEVTRSAPAVCCIKCHG